MCYRCAGKKMHEKIRGRHAKVHGRMTHVRMRTTCRRHITRKFGLKSRKKIWEGENREKTTWGGSYGNTLFFGLIVMCSNVDSD